ncbi:hypothetical protein KOW79_003868 [Hemibagrus wyckioides]|uniref:Uncharacterized protein n=1 Tax=Hemibagrus wyckioides TaxID=337641 RepID=A0A9D3P0R8_9TELE|nr:hypothetical protein KOW79_003868 [Hemibagrus wyckioides]
MDVSFAMSSGIPRVAVSSRVPVSVIPMPAVPPVSVCISGSGHGSEPMSDHHASERSGRRRSRYLPGARGSRGRDSSLAMCRFVVVSSSNAATSTSVSSKASPASPTTTTSSGPPYSSPAPTYASEATPTRQNVMAQRQQEQHAEGDSMLASNPRLRLDPALPTRPRQPPPSGTRVPGRRVQRHDAEDLKRTSSQSQKPQSSKPLNASRCSVTLKNVQIVPGDRCSISMKILALGLGESRDSIGRTCGEGGRNSSAGTRRAHQGHED